MAWKLPSKKVFNIALLVFLMVATSLAPAAIGARVLVERSKEKHENGRKMEKHDETTSVDGKGSVSTGSAEMKMLPTTPFSQSSPIGPFDIPNLPPFPNVPPLSNFPPFPYLPPLPNIPPFPNLPPFPNFPPFPFSPFPFTPPSP